MLMTLHHNIIMIIQYDVCILQYRLAEEGDLVSTMFRYIYLKVKEMGIFWASTESNEWDVVI